MPRKRKAKPMQTATRREPNGRLSRRAADVRDRDYRNAQEAMSVAVAARARHTGLPEDVVSRNVAGQPNAGTVHGVMTLRHEMTREQWEAAEWYIGTRSAWLRSIQARDTSPGQYPSGEPDEAAYARWCRSIAETWDAVQDCLRDCAVEARSPVQAALDVMLLRNQHMPHMVGDLRLALNAIHRRFLGGRRPS